MILPALLYGMETIHTTTTNRRNINGTQHALVGRMLLVLRRTTESLRDYCRRRERLITTTISKHSRGVWSQLWWYRQLTFVGHVSNNGEDRDGGRNIAACCRQARGFNQAVAERTWGSHYNMSGSSVRPSCGCKRTAGGLVSGPSTEHSLATNPLIG